MPKRDEHPPSPSHSESEQRHCTILRIVVVSSVRRRPVRRPVLRKPAATEKLSRGVVSCGVAVLQRVTCRDSHRHVVCVSGLLLLSR